MDLIARFARRPSPIPAFASVPSPPPASVPAPGPAPTPADASDGPPRGCGWFDSSHELQCGLLITEHDSPDRVANDLPLDVWLAWHLAGRHGAQGSGAARA